MGVQLTLELHRLVLVSGEDGRILQAAEKLAKAHNLNVLGALRKPVSSEQLQHILDGKPRRGARALRAARKIYEPDELRRAIAGGELVNYYQPKVALATGTVAGVETLGTLAAFPGWPGVSGSLTSLVLEVTESRLMKDSLAPLDILARLRLKRIGLSIDDRHRSLVARPAARHSLRRVQGGSGLRAPAGMRPSGPSSRRASAWRDGWA